MFAHVISVSNVIHTPLPLLLVLLRSFITCELAINITDIVW